MQSQSSLLVPSGLPLPVRSKLRKVRPVPRDPLTARGQQRSLHNKTSSCPSGSHFTHARPFPTLTTTKGTFAPPTSAHPHCATSTNSPASHSICAIHPPTQHPATTNYNMAETAQQGGVPTFKLVLVGDGGTGKVRKRNFQLLRWHSGY